MIRSVQIVVEDSNNNTRPALSPPQDPFSKLFKNPLYTASVSMLIFITTHYWFWSKKGRNLFTYLIGLGFVVSVI